MARPAFQVVFPAVRQTKLSAGWSRPSVAGPSRHRTVCISGRYGSSSAKHADQPDPSESEAPPIQLGAPADARHHPATHTSKLANQRPVDPSGEALARTIGANSSSAQAQAKRDVQLDDRIAQLRVRAADAYAQANWAASAWSAETRKQAQARFERLRSEISRLSWRINEATGYEEIDQLKAMVAQREDDLQTARDRAKAAKSAYDTAVTSRSSAQASVNSLLERKHMWTDADVSTFTSLIRSDHSSTAAVSRTSAELDAAEAAVDRAFSALTQAILRRYHEEQVWSDKIRSFSTWASIAGLGINLVVFLTAIVLVEPWKRRKMAEGIEGRMGRMMEQVEGRIEGLKEQLAAQVIAAGSASTDLPLIPPVETSEQGVLDAAPDLALVMEAPSSSSPAVDLVGRPPLLQTVLPDLPSRLAALSPITVPSHDRDLAVAATVGVAVGAMLVGATRIFRN